jgi:hypothetical protein
MANHLPQHTIVSPPNDANQENVAPSADPLANVRSTAREALAAHIDRSAKESGKRSRGPRSSDAEKVESLLCFVDGAGKRSRSSVIRSGSHDLEEAIWCIPLQRRLTSLVFLFVKTTSRTSIRLDSPRQRRRARRSRRSGWPRRRRTRPRTASGTPGRAGRCRPAGTSGARWGSGTRR